VSSGVVGAVCQNLDLQNRISCLETERNLISEVGDFLLETPAKLVLPEVASRAALAIE
jgi:predicted nuclease of restriction endonuclease-like (RecB) superfamily